MRIDHVAIYTNDLEKLRLFYETYFNGKANTLYHNKVKGFQSYFISFDDNTRLEIMSSLHITEKVESLNYLGIIHLAFQVCSKEEVDRLTNRLKEDGYTIVSGPRTTGDGYYESCILDPDGNQVEIVG